MAVGSLNNEPGQHWQSKLRSEAERAAKPGRLLGVTPVEAVSLPHDKHFNSFSVLTTKNIMLFNRSDPQASKDESGERLLAEEEGTPWSRNEESATKDCRGVANALSHMTALAVFFLVGSLFGFSWRGDVDGLCGAHTSQYCEAPSLILA